MPELYRGFTINKPNDPKWGQRENTFHKSLIDNVLDNRTSDEISVDTSQFTRNLTPDDDTVQKALDKIDAFVLGITGPTGPAGPTGTIESVDYLDFNTNAIVSRDAGRLSFDKPSNTLAYNPITPNNDVTISIGKEDFFCIKNDTGQTIYNGQAICITGATGPAFVGGDPLSTVTLVDASYESDTYICDGIATHDIASGNTGIITSRGYVRDLDLSAFSVGELVYASDVTPGGYIKYGELAYTSRQTAIGIVVDNDATTGILNVRRFNESPDDQIPDRLSYEFLIGVSSTGIVRGCALTVINNTTVSVDAGLVQFIDFGSYAVPNQPPDVIIYDIPQTNVTIPVGVGSSHWVYIDSTGTILTSPGSSPKPNPDINVVIGLAVHITGTMESIYNLHPLVTNLPITINEFSEALGPIKNGCAVVANGANTSININEGTVTLYGTNPTSIGYDSHTLTISPATAPTVLYAKRDGLTGLASSTLDAAQYDLNGTLTPVANNRYSNQRLYLFGNDTYIILYGQHIYNSIIDAVNAIESETLIFPNSLNTIPNVLLSVITLQGNTTDLTNITQARIRNTGKLGDISSTGGGAGANASPQYTIVPTSVNYTAKPREFVLVTANTPITITLPTAVGIAGYPISVKKVAGSSTVTVDAADGETIDGTLTKIIQFVNSNMILVSDGTNWQIQ